MISVGELELKDVFEYETTLYKVVHLGNTGYGAVDVLNLETGKYMAFFPNTKVKVLSTRMINQMRTDRDIICGDLASSKELWVLGAIDRGSLRYSFRLSNLGDLR